MLSSTALREISALKGLQHVNIVKLLDILLKEGVLYLVFEFVEKDLRGFLEPFTNIGLDYTDAKRYLYQLVDAIAYCHGKQMLHRDLKPSNLLIDRHGTLKLADFGMARTICVRARPYNGFNINLTHLSSLASADADPTVFTVPWSTSRYSVLRADWRTFWSSVVSKLGRQVH